MGVRLSVRAHKQHGERGLAGMAPDVCPLLVVDDGW